MSSSRPASLFLLACLSLTLRSVAADIPTTGAGTATPASYTGPGDIVSGATAWYGLRAYDAAYASSGGNAINVRNTATSETCNVPVVATGGLGNVAGCSGSSSGDTLATFCAESGGSCAVTEAYDQTRNGYNVVQSTAADQPDLVLSGAGSNSEPYLGGNTNGVLRTSSNFTPGNGKVSFVTVCNRVSGSTSAGFIVETASENGLDGYSTNNEFDLQGGVSSSVFTASWGAWHAISAVLNGSSSVANVDGTETSLSATGNTTAAQTVFANSTSVVQYTSEGGFYDEVTFTSAQRSSLCHNMYEYYGTAASC